MALKLKRASRAPRSAFFVHPTAVVDAGAAISPDVQIWHFCHVMPGARIGRGSKLGQNVFVDRGTVIGRNVKIQNNVSVYRGVTLGDDVFVGPSAVFTNVQKPRSAFPRKIEEYHGTKVQRGATIGANATIVCGVTVGEHAFIGAGSVVTRDVPAHGLVYGNPAKRRGWMCRCGEKLPPPRGARPVRCVKCRRSYAAGPSRCRLL